MIIQKHKNDALKSINEQSKKKLEKIGIPNAKIEDYRFTNMGFLNEEYTILKNEKTNYIPQTQNHIIFVDGIYSNKLSKIKDIKISDSNKIISEDNFLSILNSAYMSEIKEITVPEGCSKDIRITHVNTQDKIITVPRIIIKVNKNANINILEEFTDENEQRYCSVPILEFELGDNTHITHARVQNQNNNSFHLGRIICKLNKDAKFISFILNKGSLKARNEIMVCLEKENSDARLYGLYDINENRHSSNYSLIHHKVKNTESYQLYNGILNDNAKGVFRGRIIVEKDAQKVNSYQMNRNLVLGKNATVNSLPQLEIAADDVKCSHGSTIGQLNAEELFYLSSRGIKKEDAIKMICNGFSLEPVNKLNPVAKKFVEEFL